MTAAPLTATGEIARLAVEIDDVVQAVNFFIMSSTNGLFHVSGSQILTRYELLQILLHLMGFRAILIPSVTRGCLA